MLTEKRGSLENGELHEMDSTLRLSTLSLSLSTRPHILRVEDILDDYEHNGVRCMFMSESTQAHRNLSPRDACDMAIESLASRKGHIFWIDVEGASDDDMVPFQETFDIHPLTCYDCVSRDMREKWECTSRNLFVVLHEVMNSQNHNVWLRMVPLKVLIFPTHVITFHERPLVAVDEVIKMFESKFWKLPTPDWCFYHLLKAITRFYELRSRSIMFEVESINELVLALSASSSDSRDLLGRIRNASAQLNSLTQAVVVKQDLFSSLCLRSKHHISEDVLLYIKSVLDSILRTKLQLQMSRDMIETSLSNYIASVNIQDARLSQKTNDSVKKLTAVTTIMLPLTLIAGLFGMNVFVPGDEISNLSWFLGICGFMLVLTIAAWGYFRHIRLI